MADVEKLQAHRWQEMQLSGSIFSATLMFWVQFEVSSITLMNSWNDQRDESEDVGSVEEMH